MRLTKEQYSALLNKKIYKKRRVQHEKKDHVKFYTQVCKLLPKIAPYIYKIEHAGKKDGLESTFLKMCGLKPGMFDYFITVPRYGILFPGLWLEFKHGKKKLSPDQLRFKELQESQGYKCEVVYSPEEGIKAIKEYLGL